ncbi:MAG: pyrimidine-nucleoside phosphorylase, partial [Actinomycetota bacterium]
MGDPRDAVAKKRDGGKLTEEELRTVVLGYAREEVPDYLAAAFLMAAFIRGLDGDETVSLTRAMVESGRTLPLEGVSRPKVDKHSTGGVADGVTLVFAPLAASLGLAVAKLSGRGLGHT